MTRAAGAEEGPDELEPHPHDLARPDECSFYLLLIEMPNVRAQLSMLTGRLLGPV